MAAPVSLAATPLAAASAEDLTQIGAGAATARIRRGELKAETYAARLLQQLASQQHLNTVITVDPERVLEAARAVDLARAKGSALGPLAGLPFLVKDQMDIAGYPTTAGDPFLKGYVAKRSATVADVMMRAGAVMLAKANCQDMTGATFTLTAVTSSNPFFGFVRNPYDPARVPGGSSGGNGAALAARIAPVAIGEDTGGSVRIPASFNGVAGFRPSTHTLANALGRSRLKRYPDDGMVPPAGLLDTWGPMARSVADVALLDAVITGESTPAVELRGARIGTPSAAFWESGVLEPGVAKVLRAALARLAEAGAVLVEVDIQAYLDLNVGDRLSLVRRTSPARPFADWLAEHVPGVTMEQMNRYRDAYPPSFGAVSWRPPPPELSHDEAMAMFAAAARGHVDLFQTHGIVAIALPTEPVTAPLINVNGDTPGQKILVNGRWVDELATLLSFTVIGPRLGAPCLSLPAGLADGLPVGLELDGLPGDDGRLLGLGVAIERVLGPIPPPPLR